MDRLCYYCTQQVSWYICALKGHYLDDSMETCSDHVEDAKLATNIGYGTSEQQI